MNSHTQPLADDNGGFDWRAQLVGLCNSATCHGLHDLVHNLAVKPRPPAPGERIFLSFFFVQSC